MNINNINVNKYPISQMFDPETKIIYEIPKYQRAYTWGKYQWEPLFDDLTENNNGHFLGSIICINTSTDSINAPKFEVVDGQQRLTTLSILMVALYSELHKHYAELNEDQQIDVRQIKWRLVLKKTTSGIRVVPQVQSQNLEDYKGLLAENGLIPPHSMPKFAGNRRILKAYRYFKKRIDGEVSKTSDPIAKLFDILEKINSAILVMIDVSNHADAYTLFESLNNRGTPLTAIDLIKNSLLAKLDLRNSENLDDYFTQWTQMLELLGDDYAIQERFFRQNYNAFRSQINKPFLKPNEDRKYPLGSLATRSTMLDIYERMVAHDPRAFLETTLDHAKTYSVILLRCADDLPLKHKEALLDLQRAQGTPSYLLLLYLLQNKTVLELSDEIILKIIDLLVRFFVRRNLTDTPATRDLTRLFMAFIEETEINQYTADTVYVALRKKLIIISSSDEFFEKALRGAVYTDNLDITRFILCALAKQGMTIETQIDLWGKSNDRYIWTIEHIFPQGENIPKCWANMIADGDMDRAKELQELYVHTFGNLTITGYNSSLSNRPFQEKKNHTDASGNYIGYRNGLNLNADVCDKDVWTVAFIQQRTERLVTAILKLFAL